MDEKIIMVPGGHVFLKTVCHSLNHFYPCLHFFPSRPALMKIDIYNFYL